MKPDGNGGYGLSLCSPGDLDLSRWTSYGIVDLNHDGFQDLLMGGTRNSGGEVLVFLNDKTGSGTVVLSATLSTGAAEGPNMLDTADLDGDGSPDIVAANGGDGTFGVRLNDGSGGFPSVKQYVMGSDVALLASVDVNGDGFPDVVTESSQDQTVSVRLNNGDGGFAASASYSTGGQVGSLSFADLNGDGYPDILVSTNVIDSLATLGSTSGATLEMLNNGDGTFSVGSWVSNSTYSGNFSLSGSGVDLTISASGIALLTGQNGATPAVQSGSVVVVSGTGKITPPPSQVTTTPGGGTSSGKVGSANSPPSANGGGGEVEWLSLTLLGLAGFLRRKRD